MTVKIKNGAAVKKIAMKVKENHCTKKNARKKMRKIKINLINSNKT